jgi:iron complex outermembrane receptor protein
MQALRRVPCFPVRPLLTLAIAMFARQTLAQPIDSTVEEIVVTADFRQQGLNDIAASVRVLDAALMQRRNAQHLEDVLHNAPNVNFAAGASRARYVQLRGIGETGQFVEPLNPSVGLLIDGIDFSGLGAAAMLYDMAQVEVLQGPQGTRYGSNALAGLINLQSKAPTDTLDYGLQLQRENYRGTGMAGFVSGPVSRNAKVRLAGQRLRSDGFSINTFLGRPTNTRDERTLRGTLAWQPSETLAVTARAGHIDVDNGYDAFSLDNRRDTLSDQPGFDRQRSNYLAVQATSSTSAAYQLEALATVAHSDVGYGYDEDWVHPGFHPDEYASTDRYLRDHATRSAELRLLSTPEGALFGGRTRWVTGAYLLRQAIALNRVYTYADDFGSQLDMQRRAVYADTTTTLDARWSLDAGLRAEHYRAGYLDSTAVRFTPDEALFGGKLALNFRTDAGQLLYASIARGYKSGGFNTDGSLDADLRSFDAETLWNYELGFKGTLVDGRLSTQLALFYMDRGDVQIQSSTTRVRADGSAEFIDFTGNAATGFNRGLEWNLDFSLSDRLTLQGTLGVLDSAYADFINSAGRNLDGREQAQAPVWQYSIGVDWQLRRDLALDVNLQSRAAFYFSDSHDFRSQPYELLNASLRWQRDRWQLTLWGRNLTDRDYAVRGFFFGNDPREGYRDRGFTQLGEPRRYGLTVDWQY